MNIENYIEAQYRELKDRRLNSEFQDLYIGVENAKFREILSTLTQIIFYIMTGRTNVDKIKDTALQEFVQKGLNADKEKRFQNVTEIIQTFRKI